MFHNLFFVLIFNPSNFVELLDFYTSNYQFFLYVLRKLSNGFHCYRLDGGVSNNDFIAQLVADLTGLRVERPVHVEMSSQGCAHIVGYKLGKLQLKRVSSFM